MPGGGMAPAKNEGLHGTQINSSLVNAKGRRNLVVLII
jgi:hypothetical protein